MRFLVLLILALLLLWYFLPDPETDPGREAMPVEETFIGDQHRALEKAKNLEAELQDATRERLEQIDQQTEASDPEGGGQR